LPPNPPPPSASFDEVKLNDALDNNTVASTTLSWALLLSPTDSTPLPDGSLSTLFATMNQQLKELACYCNDIVEKYDKMHTLITEAWELVDARAI
jgi:hypothetical protein